jgi:hypothetical protein
MTDLTAAEALRLRLAALLLRDHPSGAPRDVAGVVEWFGAMQAQDLSSAMWSLGLRLPGSTAAGIHDALERREALRTWPMRGTVHLVPPRDARWMLELTGERALTGVAARRANLGLTEAMADKGVEALAAALRGRRLTRAECVQVLTDAGVTATGQIGYHMLWYASQRGVTCIAPNVGKEQTFVLLDEWAPEQASPSPEEALGILALRYFRSHGPATRQDLARWAGLTAAEVRQGIAAAGDALTTVRVDGAEMVADPALLGPHADADDVLVLPGFDEYMLGYKDRSMMLDDAHKEAIVPGGNGVFQSTIVRAGRVVGTWKRTVGAKTVTVDARALVDLSAADRSRVSAAFEPYAAYLGLALRVRWS